MILAACGSCLYCLYVVTYFKRLKVASLCLSPPLSLCRATRPIFTHVLGIGSAKNGIVCGSFVTFLCVLPG